MRRSGLLASLWLVALVVSGCLGESLVGAPPGDGGGMDAFLDGSDTGTGCPAGQVACGGRCTTLAVDPANCGACGTACGDGMVCAAGACQVRCPAPQSVCGGQCVTLQTDVTHCGTCDTACPSGQVCSLGRCSTSCDASLATCGGSGSGDGGAALYCADARTDRLNCGACGNACATGEICVNRACQLSCPMGQSACGAACRDLQTDDAHCGTCDRACPPGNACTAGECVASCSAGLTLCAGVCTNLRTDNASCGACGTACPAGQVCSGGACGTTCAPPLATCTSGGATSCADTAIDPAHCGDCATTCTLANTATAGCTAGACAVVRCAATYGDCDGVASNGCETSTLTNVMHCGGCGRACALPHATSACAVGACVVMACATGYADCNNDPSDGCEVNTATDRGHCGACATACAAGQVCSAGACGATCGAPLATCGATGSAFCADTAVDPAHCGSCDVACALDRVTTHGCAARACTVGTCATGYGNCDGLAPNGCETDTRTSLSHCGGCGRVCALPNATAACTAGACAVGTCATGYADCNGNPSDGCEVNTRTDNGNCGACATACAAGQVCSNGACGATCGGGLTTCGTAPSTFCANTAIDPTRCGSCTTSCALTGTALTGCSAGLCTVVRCNAGAGDCNGDAADGCETNTQMSLAHCGACGRSCALPNATATCAGGTCAIGACAAGYADCDGVAANGCEVHTASDNGSCGVCGTVCAAGRVCAARVCATTCGSTLTTCDGTCADTAVDPAHCGSCTTVCALAGVSVQACVRGGCVVGGCAAGFGDCDGAAANGCETATRGNDVANCGGCGLRCAFANAGATCLAGTCTLGACATGYADCDGVASNGCETNTTTDRSHCGACSVTGASRACASGQVCSAGVCGASCGSGTVNCSGDCVRTATNVDHCGGCGRSCALDRVSVQACAGGGCVVGGCAVGFGDCDGIASNGCETATRGSDVGNCGGCGLRCEYPNAAATCTAGVCARGACQQGYADCDGVASNGCEVALASDSGHCGICATACGGGQVCAAGVCAASCGTGTVNCGGDCVRTATNVEHCGGCGRVCALASVSVQACAASGCVVAGCAANRGDCNAAAADGCETDTAVSVSHCGGCGAACALPHVTTQTCAAGVCTIAMGACADGWADCNGLASDGCEVNLRGTDGGNCGACATTCPAGRVCTGGVCATTCGAGLTTCPAVDPVASYCANAAVDPSNCGACGRACSLLRTTLSGCASGSCTVVTCEPGFGDCDGQAPSGCETSLATTVAHCGGCGRSCALPHVTTQTCAAGACTIAAGSCAVGRADCNGVASDGCEANLRGTDGANCGACNMACPVGQVCAGGVCGATCGGGLATCGSGMTAFCANTLVDPAHCGGCGAACSLTGVAVEGCAAGACTVVTCDSGVGDCNGMAADGCEINTTTSAAHCGGCGRACVLPHVATSSCAAGACAVTTCTVGYADCNGTASDGCEVNLRGTDGANCGVCGTSCPTGQVCTGGVCGATCGGGLTTCPAVGSFPSYCANTVVDPAHCGACGTACTLSGVAIEGCASGNCTVVTCDPNTGDCNGTASDGCETPTLTTVAHCGGCGRSCALPHVVTQTCTAGLCRVAAGSCEMGWADCNGTAADGCEVNLRGTDGANCGACGTTCDLGRVCTSGACAATCGSGLTTCGIGLTAFCANTVVDPAHCGACGAACSLTGVTVEGCVSGACTVVTCDPGVGDCNRTADDGCETNLTTSRAHCGGCGRACALPNVATQACTAGACVVAAGTCATGYADCNGLAADGCEAVLATDSGNCGACAAVGPTHVCGAGRVCSAGMCAASCGGTLSTCPAVGLTPSYCANAAVDPSNCGVCGRACALANVSAPVCAGGACAVTGCNAGYANCDGLAPNGCEVDTANTVGHCGACGRVCSSNHVTAACAGGVCNGACASGYADCNGNRQTDGCEVGTSTDVSHCGGCGVVCSSNNITRTCVAGACVGTCAAGYADCNGNKQVDGCEVRTAIDPDHCGGCGMACPAVANGTAYCAAGGCGFVCNTGFQNCGGTCVVSGACVAPMPPRPIAPLSTATVTSRRPTLRWALGSGGDGAHIDLCRNRAMTVGCTSFDALGTSGAPGADLMPGGWFWRATTRAGGFTTSASGPVWQFLVGARTAAVGATLGPNTSSGTTLDVNGDGFADLVVGAYYVSSYTGRAHVYLGSATGVAATPATSLTGPDGMNGSFGFSVASAGDVNGDGYADLVVGAAGAMGGMGRAYVYLGGATGLSTTPATRLEAPVGSAGNFGRSVASAGDVNGDGYADLIVGAYGFSSGTGRAYVFLGSVAGISALPTTLVGRGPSNDFFGYSVASAGDVNGDGFADVVVGSKLFTNSSEALVYLGSAVGISSSINGAISIPGSESTVASAGDVNGDGFADPVLGAYAPVGGANVGAFVFRGSVAGVSGASGTAITSPVGTPDAFGSPVASAGDVNGDGYADLVVVASGALSGRGGVYVFPGSASGLSSTPAIFLPTPADATGSRPFAVSAGDVNGDGFVDLVVGHSTFSNGTGRVYVYLGSAMGVFTTPPTFLTGPDGLDGYFGYSVAIGG